MIRFETFQIARRRLPLPTVAFLCGLLVLLLPACGDDDDGPTDPPNPNEELLDPVQGLEAFFTDNPDVFYSWQLCQNRDSVEFQVALEDDSTSTADWFDPPEPIQNGSVNGCPNFVTIVRSVELGSTVAGVRWRFLGDEDWSIPAWAVGQAGDAIPPSAVADLDARRTASGATVSFSWPADDEIILPIPVERIEIRYAETADSLRTLWSSCRLAPESATTPQEPGTSAEIEVELPESSLFLALRSYDAGGNASEISNVVSVEFVPPITECIVAADGTGRFLDLRSAFEHLAAEGADACTVWVADGTYTGERNRNWSAEEGDTPPGIVVTSLSGDPTECVIDFEGASGRLGESVELIAIGFMDASILLAKADASGSALRARECRFEEVILDGTTEGRLSTATFEDCDFVDCISQTQVLGFDVVEQTGGSVIGCAGSWVGFADAAIEDVRFESCVGPVIDIFDPFRAFIQSTGPGATRPDATVSLRNVTVTGFAGAFLSGAGFVETSLFENCDGTLIQGLFRLDGNDFVNNLGAAVRLVRTVNEGPTSSLEVRNTVFAGQDGVSVYNETPGLRIENCTFADGLQGPYIDNRDEDVTVESSILAFLLSGPVVGCSNDAFITVGCTSVFGNFEGDWISCLAGQERLRRNVSTDPLFCGDFAPTQRERWSLQQDSPLGNVLGCGQVGARDVGCDP